MAESLSNIVRNSVIQSGLLLWISVTATFALAENLSDPTRPPVALGFAQEANIPVSTSGPVLQSVLISPGRMVAIINGQTVKLGEKFGDAYVVKITETEVVLRKDKDIQILKLFPGIEKRLTFSRTGTKSDSLRQ